MHVKHCQHDFVLFQGAEGQVAHRAWYIWSTTSVQPAVPDYMTIWKAAGQAFRSHGGRISPIQQVMIDLLKYITISRMSADRTPRPHNQLSGGSVIHTLIEVMPAHHHQVVLPPGPQGPFFIT
jgi:hypothetical protein